MTGPIVSVLGVRMVIHRHVSR
ncbi:MAG: hypothetical protein ACLUI6_09370 [Butyricicoccus sp.]